MRGRARQPDCETSSRKRFVAAALLSAVAVGLVAKMAFLQVADGALVTMPMMLLVFALLHLQWRVVYLPWMYVLGVGTAGGMTRRSGRVIAMQQPHQ